MVSVIKEKKEAPKKDKKRRGLKDLLISGQLSNKNKDRKVVAKQALFEGYALGAAE